MTQEYDIKNSRLLATIGSKRFPFRQTRTLLLFVGLVCLGCTKSSPDTNQSSFKPLGIALPSDAKSALRGGSAFKLYSIDPSFGGPGPGLAEFHGFGVLGVTDVSESDRRRLVDELDRGAKESVGAIAACFNPRHGISVVVDGIRHDFLICFECSQIRWYIDGNRQPMILTSETPQSFFDQVLSDSDIPLADPS